MSDKGEELKECRVEYISVHIDSTSGDPVPCLICEGKMDRTFLRFVIVSPSFEVRNEGPVPGYRCRKCTAEWYDGSTTLRLFTEVLLKLDLSSDPGLMEALKQRVASLTEALARLGWSKERPAQLPLERNGSDGRE